MAEYLTIHEICNKYSFALIDACSFIVQSGFSTDKHSSIEKKINRAVASNENLSFWIDKIPSYKNIYSTEGVIKEIREFKYNYKKAIKLPTFDKSNPYDILKLKRELSENKKNNVRLSNILESENRLLKINDSQKDIYDSFYEKYYFFIDKLKLSEVDLDLLLLGGVLSRQNKTSIISNDLGIRDAWKLFLRRENLLEDRLHLYSNCDINFFKKWELNS